MFMISNTMLKLVICLFLTVPLRLS